MRIILRFIGRPTFITVGGFPLRVLVVVICISFRVWVLALVFIVLIIVILIIIVRFFVSCAGLGRPCFSWLGHFLLFLGWGRVVIITLVIVSPKLIISIFIKEVAVRVHKTSILVNVKALFIILALFAILKLCVWVYLDFWYSSWFCFTPTCLLIGITIELFLSRTICSFVATAFERAYGFATRCLAESLSALISVLITAPFVSGAAWKI